MSAVRRGILRLGLLVAGVSLLAGLPACSAVRTDGPLKTPSPHGMTLSPVEVGQPFTYGFEVLFVTGSDDVSIVSVELLEGDTQLTLVDAKIADETRPENFAGDTAFPPVNFRVGSMADATGAVLRPESEQAEGLTGYQLLLVLRLEAPGSWTRETVRVEYESGGRRFRWDSPAQISACTPSFAKADGTCPTPPEPDWIAGDNS